MMSNEKKKMSRDARAVLEAARRVGKADVMTSELAEAFAQATRHHLRIAEDGHIHLIPEEPSTATDASQTSVSSSPSSESTGDDE